MFDEGDSDDDRRHLRRLGVQSLERDDGPVGTIYTFTTVSMVQLSDSDYAAARSAAQTSEGTWTSWWAGSAHATWYGNQSAGAKTAWRAQALANPGISGAVETFADGSHHTWSAADYAGLHAAAGTSQAAFDDAWAGRSSPTPGWYAGLPAPARANFRTLCQATG